MVRRWWHAGTVETAHYIKLVRLNGGMTNVLTNVAVTAQDEEALS